MEPEGHRGRRRRRFRGPGWRSAGTLAVTETVSFGVLSFAFAVLLVPMEAALDASRGELAGAFGLSVVVRALAAPFVGAWIDRRGARGLMTLGSAASAALVFAWGGVTDVRQLTFVFVALGVTSAAVLYEPAFAVAARWFDGRDRADAILVITTAAGFASTIFMPLTAVLVESFGWREALRWLALILAVTTVLPHALFLRDPGDTRTASRARRRRWRPADGVGVREAFRDPALRWLTAGFVAGTMPVMAMSAHLPALLIDRGEAATAAATIAGGIGVMKVAGRIGLTIAQRSVPFPLLLVGVFGVQAAALVALAIGGGRATTIGFVVAFGAGAGAITIAKPLIVATAYGRRSYATIAGTVAVFVTLAQAAAPALAGLGYDRAGDYEVVLYVLAASALTAALCMWRLRHPEDSDVSPSRTRSSPSRNLSRSVAKDSRIAPSPDGPNSAP
jgi:MFS family permease